MKKVEDIKVLVVGDIMLDKYVIGTVDRISPEAPVPIVNVIEEYSTLGGCGNVVRNVKELGAQVDCLSSVGHDIEGSTIVNELKKIGVNDLILNKSKRTIVKERIISEHRLVQMLRIDREVNITIPGKEAIEYLDSFSNGNYDIILISDYAKGFVTHELIKYLKKRFTCNIIVDPKPQNAWMYNDVFMLTPNEKEWIQMKQANTYKLDKVKYILQTLGKKGMKLIEGNKELYIEAEPVEIYNVSGAGDTVIAVIGVCLSMGIGVEYAVSIANKCAAYVVTQSGTAVVPKTKFESILKNYIY